MHTSYSGLFILKYPNSQCVKWSEEVTRHTLIALGVYCTTHPSIDTLLYNMSTQQSHKQELFLWQHIGDCVVLWTPCYIILHCMIESSFQRIGARGSPSEMFQNIRVENKSEYMQEIKTVTGKNHRKQSQNFLGNKFYKWKYQIHLSEF